MNPPYHLQFTEEMKGFFCFGEADYQRGFDRGQAADSAVMFHLTIATEDTFAFEEHELPAELAIDARLKRDQRSAHDGGNHAERDREPRRSGWVIRLWSHHQ